MAPRSSASSIFFLVGAAALVACGGSERNNPLEVSGASAATTTTTSASSGEGGGGVGGGGVGGGTGGSGGMTPDMQKRGAISGDMTWQVTFDPTAQAAGATDCTYTRHYQGFEDLSAPWRCPACEVVYQADVEMTAGLADCFSQVSPDPPATHEWIGYGNGVWYRGAELTAEQGTADVTASAIATANTVTDLDALVGGKMGFQVTGAFQLAEEEGDPQNGFEPPAVYACGWPKADPPAYDGDYLIQAGATLPDGVFRDACDEPVRLHDFKGSYLFVEMSARDCPPCQLMAGDEEAFVTDMEANGVSVHVLTLLAPSLADPLGPTTNAMVTGWIGKFDLKSPVLADRAWGVSMFLPLFPDNLAYPSWILVDPDLKVMQFGSGYGGFAEFESAILADMP